jgi:hypothetical protein
VNDAHIGDTARLRSRRCPCSASRGLWHVGGDFWLDAIAQYFAVVRRHDAAPRHPRRSALANPNAGLAGSRLATAFQGELHDGWQQIQGRPGLS